jgi:inhibitor of cysteine peptidase
MAGSGDVKDPKRVVVDDSQQGRTVSIPQDAALVVRLKVQLSTGFSYQIAELNEKQLRRDGEPTIEPAGGHNLGSPEIQVFRFKPVGKGTGVLKFNYVRPFDPKETPPAKFFQVTIEVK